MHKPTRLRFELVLSAIRGKARPFVPLFLKTGGPATVGLTAKHSFRVIPAQVGIHGMSENEPKTDD